MHVYCLCNTSLVAYNCLSWFIGLYKKNAKVNKQLTYSCVLAWRGPWSCLKCVYAIFSTNGFRQHASNPGCWVRHVTSAGFGLSFSTSDQNALTSLQHKLSTTDSMGRHRPHKHLPNTAILQYPDGVNENQSRGVESKIITAEFMTSLRDRRLPGTFATTLSPEEYVKA